jgi:hypothetical protein
VSGDLRPTREHRDTVLDTKLLNGVRQKLTAHRSTLEQNERGQRQELRQHQPRNAASTAQVDDAGVVGNAPCKRLRKTQGVQQMLFERRWTYRTDPLRLDETLQQCR